MRDRLHFLFLNIGHFLDHLFTLIFATVAALALTRMGPELRGAPELCHPRVLGLRPVLAAGGLARRQLEPGWHDGVFFVGIGLASIATAFARSPLEIAIGLFIIGVFAAIYHPVGLAMVVEGGRTPACASPSTACGATWASPARR